MVSGKESLCVLAVFWVCIFEGFLPVVRGNAKGIFECCVRLVRWRVGVVWFLVVVLLLVD